MATVGTDSDKPRKDRPPGNGAYPVWKTFALFSGAGLQLGVNIVVFAYLGRLAGLHYHKSWLVAVGALVGIITGASGLVIMLRRMMGDSR